MADPASATWRVRRSIPLGATYAELIEQVGESAEYRQSSREVVDAIVRAAGRPRAIETLTGLIEETFRPLQAKHTARTELAVAIDDITGALAELLSDYEQAELSAAPAV